jgi:hypothetical protein
MAVLLLVALVVVVVERGLLVALGPVKVVKALLVVMVYLPLYLDSRFGTLAVVDQIVEMLPILLKARQAVVVVVGAVVLLMLVMALA